ncbi:MAG TPA: hypothetical protein VGF55_04215, partial [Gemmataceae bacterium]
AMSRHAILLLALVAAPAAAADGPAGSYRLTAEFGDSSFTALLSFAHQNNQWTGQFLGGLDLPPQLTPSVRDVRVTGDRLRFTLVLAGNQAMTFDGKLPAGRGPVSGSVAAGDALVPVTMEPSALAKFDRTELLKEMVTSGPPTGPLFYSITAELLRGASASKAKPEEVKAWVDRAAKAAESHGVRWHIAVLLRLVRPLLDQPAYSAVALDLARRAERLLDPSDDVAVQLAVLDVLERLLRQANDPAAATVRARLDTLEAMDYRDYLAGFPVRPDPYTGRKARSDRAVLVELFTGAEDAPSMAAALAFDALARAYKPTEVVRLEYHLHLPDADPLANAASQARWAYYLARMDRAAAATPTVVINGRPGAGGGGPPEFAAAKLKQYRALIDPLLDTPAAAQLQLTAQRSGDKLSITAKVSGLSKPGEKVRLRLAVSESAVRYRGGNGLRYHQCVVRGFAGPVEGWPLPKPAADGVPAQRVEATVDVTELRAGLNRELDEYQKKNAGFVFPDRPLGLKPLVVVAFVQDDVTHEVYQAAQVEVR